MPNFAELAQMNMDDLPEVPKLPMGSYTWVVDKSPELAPTKSGNGTMFKVRCKCLGPIEDFEGDEDELKSYESSFGSIRGTIRTHQVYVPDAPGANQDEAGFKAQQVRATKEVQNFLTRVLRAEGTSIMEAISNAVNCQFIAAIRHVPDSRNKSEIVEELSNFSPVE